MVYWFDGSVKWIVYVIFVGVQLGNYFKILLGNGLQLVVVMFVIEKLDYFVLDIGVVELYIGKQGCDIIWLMCCNGKIQVSWCVWLGWCRMCWLMNQSNWWW